MFLLGANMIRYPQDMVQLRYLKRRINSGPNARIVSETLQYRVKNISVVDYSETWTEWKDVPTDTEYVDEDVLIPALKGETRSG